MKTPKLKSSSKTGDMTMLVVGDIFVQRDDPPSVFGHVRDTLLDADFLLGNLEGSVSDSGSPWSLKETNWKADARQVSAVHSASFDAVSVANNHMLDFGYDALFETLGHLDRHEIGHSGGGHNFEEAHKPAIVEHNGCRVALLAYTSVFMSDWAAGPSTPGLAIMRARTAYEAPRRVHEVPGTPPIIRTWMVQEDKDQLTLDIEKARMQADIVVCSFHWGISRGHREIVDYQIELGHHAVDSGADLVFGHHPHVIQGVEVYRDTPIFYSLGNFTFAQHNLLKGHELETMIIKCHIRGRQIVSFEYLPIRGDEATNPQLVNLEAADDIVDLVSKRSSRFKTKFLPLETSIKVVTNGVSIDKEKIVVPT